MQVKNLANRMRCGIINYFQDSEDSDYRYYLVDKRSRTGKAIQQEISMKRGNTFTIRDFGDSTTRWIGVK